jgi:hypothetical protein
MYLVPSAFTSFHEGYYRIQMFNCNSFIYKKKFSPLSSLSLVTLSIKSFCLLVCDT